MPTRVDPRPEQGCEPGEPGKAGDAVTQFVGVKDMARWIARDGLDRVIRLIAAGIEEDLAAWEKFEKVPRMAAHSDIGVIELMPISDDELYAFKYVNGHPDNPLRGIQTIAAFGALADVATGHPVFLAEMTLLTAVRTAAMSTVAAKRLARPESRVMAMIGAGSQAEFQAIGMREFLGINELRVYDVDPYGVAKLVNNLEPLGFHITTCSRVDEAVTGADIVTTCTADKQHAVALMDSHVAAGMHINAIGGDCPGKTELDPRILERARVFVEFEEQTRIEGEIQMMPADFPVTELWRVVTDRADGRVRNRDITVFDSVGFALADLSALRVCWQATAGTNLQTDIDLIADPRDPKDLFSLIMHPVEAGEDVAERLA